MDLKMFVLPFVLSIAVCNTAGYRIDVTNNCPFTVWPGIRGNPGHEHLNKGGFVLSSNQTVRIDVTANWAGRIWGRTKCNVRGACETGDCGAIECNGADGHPTASRAYVWFSTNRPNSYYISLAQGYNLPIKIEPNPSSIPSVSRIRGDDKFYCKTTACSADLNRTWCPDQLSVTANGIRVACKNPCEHYHTDEHCCQGYHGNHECKCNQWPVNYLDVLKSPCPNAHTYDYDYTTSTFSCPPSPKAVYDVVFCP